MCDSNTNEILNLNFANLDDELNWYNNSVNPIITENDMLVLTPSAALSFFSRALGNIEITNNRVRYKINMEIFRPSGSTNPQVYFVFQILNGLNVIGESTVFIDDIEIGQAVSYSLDRVYEYQELSGNISLRIKTPIGFENILRLKDINVIDYNFCDDSVRTYFVFDGLHDGAITAASAGLLMKSWQIDDQETLTNAFLALNAANIGGNPVAGWKYAKADIDGSNRVANTANSNTFNPFADEFGLLFDTVNSYWGGKVTGTQGNQDFGAGVTQLGIDKPIILNGALEPKNGAFYIDIDYTKNLSIECDVIINDTNQSVYNNPTLYRKYFIKWDAEKCSGAFYFINQLQPGGLIKDQYVNGFLSGLTGITTEDTVLPCGDTLNFTGNQGSYTFNLELGTAIGMFIINYNAQNVPDKFDIEYNGIFTTSKYRGSDTYNQALINAGVPPSDIDTANPTNGSGQLRVYKSTAFPTTAQATVTAPLGGTAWNLASVCPAPYMEVWLYRTLCGGSLAGAPIVVAYMDADDAYGYVPTDGDLVFTNNNLSTPYNGGGIGYRMKIFLANGQFQELNYYFFISASGVINAVQQC